MVCPDIDFQQSTLTVFLAEAIVIAQIAPLFQLVYQQSDLITTQSTSPTSSTTFSATSPAVFPTSHTGLSLGAKAGIGVGVSIGAVVIGVLLGLYILRRRRNLQRKEATPAQAFAKSELEQLDRPAYYPPPLVELEQPEPRELDSHIRHAELAGDDVPEMR